MTPYKSKLPTQLVELAKSEGFDASVIVPSAVGVPPDTGVSDEESDRQTDELFEDSESLAKEELADVA
jgi:hypothetical protein